MQKRPILRLISEGSSIQEKVISLEKQRIFNKLLDSLKAMSRLLETRKIPSNELSCFNRQPSTPVL